MRIETTKRLAAQREITAALGHLHKSELEAAIALAPAAEGLLPDAEGRRVSAYLQQHELSKQVDIDKTIDWLKRNVLPDAAAISEFSGRRRGSGSLGPGQRRLQRRLFGVIE